MAKLGFVIDSPLFDLSSPSAQQRTTSVPLSGKVVLTVDKPTQIKAISLKYECINSHIDLEGEVYVYYNLHRATKVIPPGMATMPIGVHEFPFTFQIPRHLPPSLKTPMGEVSHRLRASIKRPSQVSTMFHRIAGAGGTVKIPLTVFNSSNTGEEFIHRPISPTRMDDDLPAYEEPTRREWSGQRRNGKIDWLLQAPSVISIGEKIDIVAKLKIVTGYGSVTSSTVDLVQIEKYKAEPDKNAWSFPIERTSPVSGGGSDEDGDGEDVSDDGFPETRTTGLNLRQAIALTPFGGTLNTHCREKRSHPIKPVTKTFPPPPDPSPSTKWYTFHLALSIPLPPTASSLFPTHTSPLINISHRLRCRFAFSPAGTKELGMIIPITVLPARPNASIFINPFAEAGTPLGDDGFWMTLVEEEGESGVIPQRSRMNSGGGQGGSRQGSVVTELGLPPTYDEDWPLLAQERRGSIPMGILA